MFCVDIYGTLKENAGVAWELIDNAQNIMVFCWELIENARGT